VDIFIKIVCLFIEENKVDFFWASLRITMAFVKIKLDYYKSFPENTL
jgi:hypothetical protein